MQRGVQAVHSQALHELENSQLHRVLQVCFKRHLQAIHARTLEIPTPALLVPVGGTTHRGRKAGGGPRAPSHQRQRGRGRISRVLARYAGSGTSRPAVKGTSDTIRLGLSPSPTLIAQRTADAGFTGIVHVPPLSPARVRG